MNDLGACQLCRMQLQPNIGVFSACMTTDTLQGITHGKLRRRNTHSHEVASQYGCDPKQQGQA